MDVNHSESPCGQLRTSIEALSSAMGELAGLQSRLDQAFGGSTFDPVLLQQYNSLLDALAQADARRVSALKAMGLVPSDMDGAFSRCALPRLSDDWAVVRRKLPQVALTNRKHAQFLHKAMTSISTGLSLLGASAGQPSLYGPSGQREAAFNMRKLGSA